MCVGFFFTLGVLCGYVEVKDITEEKRTQTSLTSVSLLESAMLHCVIYQKGKDCWPPERRRNSSHGEIVEPLLGSGALSERVKRFGKRVKRVLDIVARSVGLSSSKTESLSFPFLTLRSHLLPRPKRAF